jgi:bacterial/archaeal transporter family-2 protein
LRPGAVNGRVQRPALAMGEHMNIAFFAFTVFLGVVLTVHLAMNSKVGAAIGNPRVANAMFWCIGAIGACVIGATGWSSGALDGLSAVNPILLTAGAIGASLVFAIAWAIPKVGAFGLMLGLLAGQILSGMLLSHFGWLGSPHQATTPLNLVGAAVMVAGALLATRSAGK